MAKFALGMLLAAAGFGLMIVASKSILTNDTGLASPLWLVGSLLLLTLGELALSPVGLSSMTKLAPKGMQGQMMGLFFASLAMGNLVAAFFGGNVSADKIGRIANTLYDDGSLFGGDSRCIVVIGETYQ